MQHYFTGLHYFVQKNKWLSTGIAFCFLVLLGFFALQIKFEEDITQLIPSNDQSGVTSKVLSQVNFADKITVIISSRKEGTPDDLTNGANTFLDSVTTNCSPYIKKIQGKIDEENIQETFDFVYENLPLFLDQKDYAAIQNKMHSDSLSRIMEGNYRSLISPTGIVTKDFILKDPLGISFMALKKMQQLSVGDDFQLQNGFVLTKDKKNLLLFITPKLPANETDKNTFFIEKLNKIKTDLNTKLGNTLSISYFGATPVAVANATQIKSDVQTTSIFAAVTLILILAFFYRSISTPIIIFIPSLCGALFALAVLYLTKGTISAISLGISSILLGETTDYSIYVLTHLRNNKNVKLLYKDISKPLLLCGATTAITFLCLFFIKSEVLKDLGVFAALSVIATTVFSLILIPLLYRIKVKKEGENPVLKPNGFNKSIIDKFGSYDYSKNKILILGVVVLLIISLFTYSKVTFNNDLSALNFMTPELKKAEKYLENISNNGSSKSIYLVTYGDSYETALENNNLLFNALKEDKNKKQILNFSSIGGIIFSKEMQLQKLEEWNHFWNTQNKSNLKNQLISNGNKFGFKANSFDAFYKTLDKKFNAISFEEYAKVKSFFLEEFVSQKKGFHTISSLVQVTNDKRDSFVNEIKKQSNIVIIDRQETNETFLSVLKKNFENLIDYSFVAIFLILLLAFRRLELVIVSIIPILISWIFTTGLMGLFGLQFNVVNIIVCTLVFGIGVDYSIFMTTALQKEYTFGKIELPTYRTSILLSVLTTILGIGVLIFAKHPALKSISIIAIIGIFSALLITFIIQPLVFKFLVSWRVKKGQSPVSLRILLHSTLSFIYYGLGGFLLSLLGELVMKIVPLKREAKMMWFRRTMSKFMKSVLYTNPFVTKKVINENNEKFDKPAIIISNHTSFLDTLAVGMLSPKIIFLVNDWVYNSPVFGRAVKLAGFYPVSQGLEGGVEHLREKINEGFSLMIFPEGQRSEDNGVKRFHKGAFYLAQEFNVDVLPVYIHGNADALPKGDHIIYDEKITVKIGERIGADDTIFGNDYAEKTKKISKHFKESFNSIRAELEDENYFKNKLFLSFLYKERDVITEVKSDFKKNKSLYFKLNKYIGTDAKILHFANDYGQLDVLLTLQESKRKVQSYITDEQRRSVAKMNYLLKKRSISYLDSVLENDEKWNTFLISNVNSEAVKALVWPVTANHVVLIDNFELENHFVDFGFSVVNHEEGILVLKK